MHIYCYKCRHILREDKPLYEVETVLECPNCKYKIVIWQRYREDLEDKPKKKYRGYVEVVFNRNETKWKDEPREGDDELA